MKLGKHHGATGRFRKMFRGVPYPYKAPDTPEGRQEALAYFIALKRRLDNEFLAQRPKTAKEVYEANLADAKLLLKWLERKDQSQWERIGVYTLKNRIHDLEQALFFPSNLPLDKDGLPECGVPKDILESFAEQLEEMKGEGKSNSLKYHAGEFIHYLRNTKSPAPGEARIMVVKKHLSLFMRKVGENADIAQVFADENDHLENFKSYLEKKNHKNGKKKLSKPYISSVLKTIRQFIKRLHTKRKIKELPRFLEEFKVKPIYRDFEPFTKEEITKLLENARPQLRAAILIALNTAALSIDIATLDYDMLDLKAGRIIRKRKKTEEEERVPEVNYILWDSTIRAIEIARSKRTKLVFLNRTKRPLNRNWLENGKYTRYDSLTQQFLSLTRKLEMPPGKTFKLLRKTSADMMADLEDVIFTERLLGHAPSTMALKHYAKKPFSQDKFDAAIVKMGEKFGFKTDYNRLTAATKEILMNKPGQ